MKYKEILDKGRFGGIFAILTTAVYLNLFNGQNEIYPYYAVLLLFKKYDIRIIRLCILIMIFSIINVIFFDQERAIINGVMAIIVILSIVTYHSLSKIDLNMLCNVFKIFIIINFVVCTLQFIFPSFFSMTHSFVSARGVEHLAILAERASVSGLGPEPSYTAALISGIMLTLYLNKSLSVFDVIFILSQFVLMKSISGFIFILMYIFLYLALKKNLLKNLLKIIIFLFIFIPIAWYSLNSRLEIFLNSRIGLDSLEDVARIESLWGSTRFANIISAIQFYNGDVGNGYSIGACLSYIFHGLIFLIIGLIISGLKIDLKCLKFIPFLFLAIFTGPALIWPLYTMPWKNKE